jgi:hypothetical protein
VNVLPESKHLPAINFSAGIQGIGTGNPGFGLTFEKNLTVAEGRALNAYAGIGWRSNEAHSHMLGGVKLALNSRWTVGLQLDGHDRHPFTTYSQGSMVIGLYLIQSKSLGIMTGFRF